MLALPWHLKGSTFSCSICFVRTSKTPTRVWVRKDGLSHSKIADSLEHKLCFFVHFYFFWKVCVFWFVSRVVFLRLWCVSVCVRVCVRVPVRVSVITRSVFVRMRVRHSMCVRECVCVICVRLSMVKSVCLSRCVCHGVYVTVSACVPVYKSPSPFLFLSYLRHVGCVTWSPKGMGSLSCQSCTCAPLYKYIYIHTCIYINIHIRVYNCMYTFMVQMATSWPVAADGLKTRCWPVTS